MFLTLIALPALAEDALLSIAPPAERAGQTETPGTTTRRTAQMEANLRYRMLSVPDSVLDIWYFDEDDAGANPFKRPSVKAWLVGAEYVVKPAPTNWTFYFEYMGNAIDEGYWDDVEDGAVNHDDGSWVTPEGFGAIIVGTNIGSEIPITNPDADVWLSLMPSGGLGIVFMTGELVEWNPGGDPENVEPDCYTDSPAYVRKDYCAADGTTRVPGVLPMLDVTVSAKVNFANRAHIRLDGGIHDLLYFGVAAGAVF